MSTELSAALREAVADAPFDDADLSAIVDAGSRRVRRRTALWVASSAAAVAAVVITAVAVGSGGADQELRPAEVVRLHLDQAEREDPVVLASVRTTWRDPANELDHDRFEGLTTDGLVLRSRYTYEGDNFELGLLDPDTRRTDWLPPPPASPEVAVELTEERLVLFTRDNGGRLLVFNRASETWASVAIRLPAGLEVHTLPRLTMGSDGRLYVGSNLEGESGPLRWWSYAVPQGGEGRPENTLEGAALAWRDGVRATADPAGRVVVTTSGEERLVADARPEGCGPPTDPGMAEFQVILGLAGVQPVVTYWCGDGPRAVTVVYDVGGGTAVQVEDAAFLAADGGDVLLAPSGQGASESHGGGDAGGVYLLDLDRMTLARIGPGIHDAQVAVAGGLLLWNSPGPLDTKQSYDVIWRVARVPLHD